MNKPKVIALYLPQFHPTPDNDKWWGKGFTEWTNVGKAKPLFPGHYQPKVPADLGYYDLRLPDVREAQAKLAEEAGIYGFCYYHYWFGNGKMELEMPFQEILKSGKPSLPFMLCWANESWHQKFWNKDSTVKSKKLLIEQEYPGEEDIIRHFKFVLPAFKDERYIKVDGKPMFMIYKPDQIPNISTFISTWNKLAISSGIPGIYFVAQMNEAINEQKFNQLLINGFNKVNVLRLQYAWKNSYPFWIRAIQKVAGHFIGIPNIMTYKRAMKLLSGDLEKNNNAYPSIIPNWDHTPRSGSNGSVFIKSSPDLFRNHCIDIFEKNRGKKGNDNYVFLKSWNEWGEGNYIEPDLKYGHKWLNALKDAINQFG